MVNVLTEQRLIDSTNKTLIKITGILDGSGQIQGATVVDVSTLAYAANANGKLMVSNTNPLPIYRTSVKKIISNLAGISLGGGGDAGFVLLQWQGNAANNTMITIGPGATHLGFEQIGGLIENPSSNSTGDILLSTVGLAANSAYTIFIELKKNGNDYLTGFPGA